MSERDDASRILHRMLRDVVAPGLRDLGFVGSGGSFALRTAATSGDHALLGIQRWRYNDAALARFTVNVAFYSAEDWSLAQETTRRHGLKPQSKPSPNQEYFCGWHDRVGYLYEPGHDHWWGIQSEADAQLVSSDVIHVVKTYVVPQLTARLARHHPPLTFYDSDQPDVLVRCGWAHCFANDDDIEDDD